MADAPFAFDRRSAGRIVAATKTVEQAFPPKRDRNGNLTTQPTLGFYPVLVKITGNLGGNAYYSGVEVLPSTADVTGSASFTGSQMGSDGAVCIVANLMEQALADSTTNTPTHSLATGTYWPGNVLRINDDGKKVVLITAQQFGCTT